MSPTPSPKRRAIRIGGASGGFTDRAAAISRLAANPTIDAIVGDWLSENVMTGYGAGKASRKALEAQRGRAFTIEELKSKDGSSPGVYYASTFLQCFEPAIPAIKANGTKLVVNAGASDTEVLAHVVRDLCREKGSEWEANVAWVEGDEVTDAFLSSYMSSSGEYRNLCDDSVLKDWGYTPVSVQAYLGSFGIVEALRRGAQIVICGRVSDAAPTIGLSAWWHDWGNKEFDFLAGSLVAGHLIECSAFVTGGYWSGFKELLKEGRHLNLGFPIVEVEGNGECVVGKEENTGGIVNTSTVTSQLVYEISGPLYFNSDVVADLTHTALAQESPDRVRVSGITGYPPPPTTRVGLTAHGGYQAEWHFHLVGLDMAEKVRWMEEQARYSIGEEVIGKFSCLEFQLLGHQGGSRLGWGSQDANTADLRIFAQGREKELFDGTYLNGFARRLYETVLQSCPGVSRPNDLRQSLPKPYYEYFVTTIPQSLCKHRVHFLFSPSTPPIPIPLPPTTKTYTSSPFSTATNITDDYVANKKDLAEKYGPTTLAPLGSIVLSRSGDKASDANIGLFVRHDDEFEWLSAFLSTATFKALVYSPDPFILSKVDEKIERFEMKNLRVVHFLIKNHLDRGYNSGSGVDTLAKNLGEWVRCRVVDVPERFLARGWV